MSVQDVAWVLEESPTTGNDRLVLIVIANHANKDDPWAYLTHDTIAHEARVSRATVIRCVARLEELGALGVRHSPGRKCNEYRLLREPSQPATVGGGEPLQQPSHEVAPTVAADPSNSRAGATQNHEPLEPKEPTSSPAARGERIPDPFTISAEMFRWALEDEGLPMDFVRSETRQFVDYWRATPGAKGRKADWPATWRNWMRRASERKPVRSGARPTVTDRTAANVAAAVGIFNGSGR